jgi:rhodanese-related sulfurtransferase
MHQTFAQEASIERATLGEAGTKTAEISTEQLRRILLDRSAIIIDTRSKAEFEAGHIPNAIALDGTAADHVTAVGRLVSGDKTKALVLYCNGPFCQASRRVGDQLARAGYSNVRRYQLGMPVWRALGGPTVVELGGVKRVAEGDRLAVFIDARPAEVFAKGSLMQARSAPIEDVLSGKLNKIDLPEDDFNRRIVLFGRDGAEARMLADFMAKRPWHNVMYFPGTFSEIAGGLKAK